MKLSELSESLFPLLCCWSVCGFLFTAGSNNLNGEDINVSNTRLNNITEISYTELYIRLDYISQTDVSIVSHDNKNNVLTTNNRQFDNFTFITKLFNNIQINNKHVC